MSSSENSGFGSALDIIKKWCLKSPSQGIRRIRQAKTLATGLFWAYIFLIFTTFMSGFIFVVIANYISHPTKIHLSVTRYRDPKHFPAITFCNINPLKNDELPIESDNKKPGEKPTVPTEDEFHKKFSDFIDRILATHVNGQPHPFVKWGFTLNDLLIKCVYNKRDCRRNLPQLFHLKYGNCYTFDNDIHVTSKTPNEIPHDWSIDNDNGDNNYKLFLELYLHQPVYQQYLVQRAAFRIFIHRKHEVPILSQNSLFLAPNRYTKLSFSQRIMRFSRQCRNELTDEMKQMLDTPHVRYTQALCYKLCEERFIVKDCQCIEPTLAVLYQYFNNNGNNQSTANISFCSVDDTCRVISRKNIALRKSCGECLPECELIQYSVQSSYASYPSVKAFNKTFQRVQTYFRDITDGPLSNRRPVLRDNIVAVEISASPYATEILTESPFYTWVDLISSIGGQTGLWIGISLLGFIEIIELIYLLTKRLCSKIFF